MNLNEIKYNLKRLAIIEAGLCQEWQFRYYSFNGKWSDNEAVASMRNGSGYEWFMIFLEQGASFCINDSENDLVIDVNQIPITIKKNYSEFLSEPALSINTSNMLGFYNGIDFSIFGSNIENNSTPLKAANFSNDDYFDWATEYYEIQFSSSLRKNIWDNPANAESYLSIVEEFDVEKFESDLAEM